MAPGTGTPDHEASFIRIRSTRRHGFTARARLPIALLSISVMLGGCAVQPPAPDTSAIPKPGHPSYGTAGHPSYGTASSSRSPATMPEIARSGDDPPASRTPPPVPLDSTVIGMLDADPTRSADPHAGRDAAGGGDAWARIGAGIELRRPKRKQVTRAIDWYRKNPEYLQRLAKRARPYLAYIAREVEKRDMPMEFALLPVVESAFRERAYSSAGASGLWQFISSTGRLYGLKQNSWYDGRRDVVESTRAALDYLTKLLQEFDDPLLAVAAYNWGEGRLRRSIARNRARGKDTDVWSLRLPRETRVHVHRFAAIASIVKEPERYGVTFEPISDRVYFRQVPIDGQVDLAYAAHLAGITFDELRRLNPGFKRVASAPGGPHRLLLPTNAAGRFTIQYAALPTSGQRRWARHAIVRGDTLGAIAQRYGTSVRALKHTNGLSSDRIIAGELLMIPVALGSRGAPGIGDTTLAGINGAVAYGSPKTIHLVRSGESLWRIARRHGVDMQQLAAWNGLSTKAILHPGQRLTVYRGGYRTAPLAPSAKPLKTSHSYPVHIVQYGDTLSEIAQRHGITVVELTEFNRLHVSTVIQPGQELRLIPVSHANPASGLERARYRVKRGDSLWVISRQFGVSIASLRRWNQLSMNEPLMPGRELFVHPANTPSI